MKYPNIVCDITTELGIRPGSVERYLQGMYSLAKEVDIANTRHRLVSRWRRGIDRPMLREYKVLYYQLGQLLGKVGEL
jgi:hypothetical protein